MGRSPVHTTIAFVGPLAALFIIQVHAAALRVDIPAHCVPVVLKGRAGGLDLISRGRQVLRVEGVCRGNLPARVYSRGSDRTVVCGDTPNPYLHPEKQEPITYRYRLQC